MQGFLPTDFNRDRTCRLRVASADNGDLSRRSGIIDAFLDFRQMSEVAGPEKAVHLRHKVSLTGGIATVGVGMEATPAVGACFG